MYLQHWELFKSVDPVFALDVKWAQLIGITPYSDGVDDCKICYMWNACGPVHERYCTVNLIFDLCSSCIMSTGSWIIGNER